MKKRFLILTLLVLLFATSTIAAPLSSTSDWFGTRPFYQPGNKINIAEHSFNVRNTGTDKNGKYVILESKEERNKIYEAQTLRLDNIEIYVESVVDDGGNKFDSAVIFIALRRNERPQGIYKGENTYEIKELGEIKLNTGNHLIIKDILKDEVLISIDDVDYTFFLKERKIIGRLSIFLDRLIYNPRNEAGTIILKILLEDKEEIKESPKKKKVIKTTEPIVVQEETIPDEEEIFEEEIKEPLNLDTIILDFLKRTWYRLF